MHRRTWTRYTQVPTAGGLSSGELIDNPNRDSSPYRSDCTDHFRTAQSRTIDFSDTTGLQCRHGRNSEWKFRFVQSLSSSRLSEQTLWYTLLSGSFGRPTYNSLLDVACKVRQSFCSSL